MGVSHAVSGAAVWLVGCAAAPSVGVHPSTAAVVVGAVVTAGWATAPDVDCPSAHPARILGPASQAVSGWIGDGCAAVYRATRARSDWNRGGYNAGHRTLTHTIVAGLEAGRWAGLLVLLGGYPAAMALLTWSVLWAVRALFPREWRLFGLNSYGFVRGRRRHDFSRVLARGLTQMLRATGADWLPAVLITPIVVGVFWHLVPVEGAGVWLGLAVGAGWLTHLLGDMLTDSGCPVLWPLPVRGQRWYRVGIPARLRFEAGALIESYGVLPLLLLAGGGAVWLITT